VTDIKGFSFIVKDKSSLSPKDLITKTGFIIASKVEFSHKALKTRNTDGESMTEQVVVERPMRVDGVNRLATKVQKVVLNRDNMNMFVLLANRRDIKNSHVSKLYKVLAEGSNFESPLVANLYSRKRVYALLDGNHRYEAMKKYFDKFPERKVEIYLIFYTDLSPEEEKEEYTKWNSGKRQSTNDFIQAYWDTIPIAKWFNAPLRGFACRVAPSWRTGGIPAIEFKTLVGAYLTKDDQTFSGGFSGSAMELVEKSQHLGDRDFGVIKSFMADYVTAYGRIDPKNMHYKQVVFYTLFRLWLKNYQAHDFATMRKMFEVIRGHRLVVEYQKLGGTRENCNAFHALLLADLKTRRQFADFV